MTSIAERIKAFFTPVRFVKNHWGWTPEGVGTWLRYGWGLPVDVWGVEVTGSKPRTFRRRIRLGPLAFGFGTYVDEG